MIAREDCDRKYSPEEADIPLLVSIACSYTMTGFVPRVSRVHQSSSGRRPTSWLSVIQDLYSRFFGPTLWTVGLFRFFIRAQCPPHLHFSISACVYHANHSSDSWSLPFHSATEILYSNRIITGVLHAQPIRNHHIRLYLIALIKKFTLSSFIRPSVTSRLGTNTLLQPSPTQLTGTNVTI